VLKKPAKSDVDLLFTADIENDWTLHELAGNDEEGGGRTEAPGVFRNVLNQLLKGQFREMFFTANTTQNVPRMRM
jgi:hypothetical protein